MSGRSPTLYCTLTLIAMLLVGVKIEKWSTVAGVVECYLKGVRRIAFDSIVILHNTVDTTR